MESSCINSGRYSYHPNIIEYLQSISVRFNVQGDYFELSGCSSMSFVEIIDFLADSKIINASSEKQFIADLSHCKGEYALELDGEYSNAVSLNMWISGEVECYGKKYFKVDNTWYTYSSGLDTYLDNFIKELDFNQLKLSVKLNPWNSKMHEKEGIYNASYIDDRKYIVADKVFVNNIELADLIRVDRDRLYLYHVKRGLGRDLRALINQILNADRAFRYDIRHNEEMIRSYYKGILSMHYEKSKLGISESKFVKAMKELNVTLVFAYSSTSTKPIKEEIMRCKSRIAKLSLLYCIRDMARSEASLCIERIIEI